ncbi:pyrophosphatase PpaX [Clostridium cylindrosporum]|uniref:Putative pyrophosphatase PpaX n=1 Tax=Clostridium cylindrosporum DSM 605 TaxID=1121307 RepID=A0A0J8DGB6_CLOCY|nr:pyrophosphatase PpaX [Clostridium cylindrosporum]KMT23279.1 putative pyrophosphatase PpaX [Clostridium cylindrosporum DSM 605]
MVKAVLFDLDGTLLDTNNLIMESFKHTYRKHLDFNVEEKEIIKNFGEPLITTLNRYSKDNIDEMLDTYRRFNYDNHDAMTSIMEGAKETLESLINKGIKLGVVTSKREVMARKGLVLFDIEKYFDTVITPELTDKHKPNPEPIYEACRNLKIKPNESIMVGDSSFDILCGKNAGAKTCLVNYTLLDKIEINKYKPDYKVDKLNDILEII